MSELVDLISDGQMDGRQSVGGQTTDVIDVNGLSRTIGGTDNLLYVTYQLSNLAYVYMMIYVFKKTSAT